MLTKLARKGAVALGLAGTLTVLTIQPAWALTATPDQTWRVSGKVYALARSGNTIFVGGKFTSVVSPDGTQTGSVDNLAAFDVTTGAWIPSFAPSVTNTQTTGAPMVRALDVSADGSTLYVGGVFDTVDGALISDLAAVRTSTGALAPGFASPEVKKPVNAILVGPSRIYLGGAFARLGGAARRHLAAIGFDGTLDPSWVPSADDIVRSLTLATDGNSIFVGGHFLTVNAEPRVSVARVSADTGALDPWTIPSGVVTSGATAWDMIATPTRLHVGFGTSGANWLSSYRLDNGASGDEAWRYKTKGNVESLALSPDGSRLFFGGHFGTAVGDQIVCGSIYMRGLASLNPSNGQLYCDWIPQLRPYGHNYAGAWTLLQEGSHLWVGGAFTSISGVTQGGIARYTL